VIDGPGPWGTGPFRLAEGRSVIDTVPAVIQQKPLRNVWLAIREERAPLLVLEANRQYWNMARGPRLEWVIFRNDLPPDEALRLCLHAEGQVDLVTEVPPAEAGQVLASPYARLVAVDASRVVAGIFNRFSPDLPWSDRRLREAVNLAVDRQSLIALGFYGYATPVAALTPPWASDAPGLLPRPFDPGRARHLLRAVGWPQSRVLRLAAPAPFAGVARLIAADLKAVLAIDTHVQVIPPEREAAWRRAVAEKRLLPNWDILLAEGFALFGEATPAFVHREYFGADGALRAGPLIPEFDRLFLAMAAQTDPAERNRLAAQIDRYAYDESLALFLCAPQALYAVNRHVRFCPYRTSFELAETAVTEEHWSRRRAPVRCESPRSLPPSDHPGRAG
jgi:peptide/nickel transport system substrate-binding protein